jgi:hypothetical protein
MHLRRKIIFATFALLVIATIAWLRSDSFRLSYYQWRLRAAAAEYGRAYRHEETRFDKLAVGFCRTLHIKRDSPGTRKANAVGVLLEMGYLRKAEWPLTNRINFGVLVTNAMRKYPGEWWELSSNPSQTVVIVTAPTNRLPDWQRLVYKLDATKQ